MHESKTAVTIFRDSPPSAAKHVQTLLKHCWQLCLDQKRVLQVTISARKRTVDAAFKEYMIILNIESK